MKDILQLTNVTASYNGAPALEGVNLTVQQGDYVAIFGPNGGGKTTLLKCILGLLQPREGSVSVFGKPPTQARDRIGYVPQYATMRDTIPAKVADVVSMGCVASPCNNLLSMWKKPKNMLAEAEKALEQVGLGGMLQTRFADLSGGQRQRVIVARALMAKPAILLLDEPTANIDPQGKFCFYEFLGSLPQNITTIVVSHDLSIATSGFSALAVVNRTLHFERGGKLTPELLASLYGEHEPSCPMGTFIANAPNMFGSLNTIMPPNVTATGTK